MCADERVHDRDTELLQAADAALQLGQVLGHRALAGLVLQTDVVERVGVLARRSCGL
jgi:hypothetical protein